MSSSSPLTIILIALVTMFSLGCKNISNDKNPIKEEITKANKSEDLTLLVQVPKFDNNSPSNKIRTETQNLLNRIDSFLPTLSKIERNLTVHDVPNTPVRIWYTNKKKPVKIEYGVVDDSGNFSGTFKLYFINGNLWYADQIYARYLFDSGKLQFWLDEEWNINEVPELDFENREQQLIEVAALLIQNLD